MSQDATHSGEWTTSAHGDQSDQDATHSGEWTTSAHGDQSLISHGDVVHSHTVSSILDPHLLMEIRVIRMLLTVENGPHLLMEIRVIRMLLTVENGPHLLMEIRVIRMLLTVENGHICSWRSE